MTPFDIVRSALLAGFGVQEKVKEFVDDLVRKGELSNSQAAKIIKEWSEKADKSSEDISKNLSDVVSRTLEKMNIATKDDIEKLNKKIYLLTARIKKLEGSEEEAAE